MPDEEGRRVRAALALAGKTPEEVAPDLNVSARTINRVIAGERQLREWEVERLAVLCGVPAWFIAEGFATREQSSEDDRLDELERLARSIDYKLDALDVVDRIAALEEAIREATAALRSPSS